MYKRVVAVLEHSLLEAVSAELRKEKVHFTYTDVKGFCGEVHLYHEDICNRLRIEVVCAEGDVERVKRAILAHAPTGVPGVGMIMVNDIEEFTDLSEIG
jgi:nitrogen regulatory protein PII